jgi:hypothetical protein
MNGVSASIGVPKQPQLCIINAWGLYLLGIPHVRDEIEWIRHPIVVRKLVIEVVRKGGIPRAARHAGGNHNLALSRFAKVAILKTKAAKPLEKVTPVFGR